MGQLIFYKHPYLTCEFKFVCRNEYDFSHIYNNIIDNIRQLDHLKISKEERVYLEGLGFQEEYLDFLENIELDTEEEIQIKLLNNGKLDITIKGLWHVCTYYEIFLLSIINECANLDAPQERIIESFAKKEFPQVVFYEFGTRRRISFDFQDKILSIIKNYFGFSGTSNVFLAKKHKIPAIGTMAHEYIQAYQQISTNLNSFQRQALYDWLVFYGGRYTCALSDTINDKYFIRDFFVEYNGFLAQNYTAIRHDSGNPIIWGLKMLQQSRFKNIKDLCLLFSDKLNPDVINKIEEEKFLKTVEKEYALGSYFVNNYHDCWDKEPLQMVIKLVKINNKPVMKLSNDSGKSICTDELFKNKFLETFK